MRRFFVVLLLMVLVFGSYGTWALTKPLPVLKPHSVIGVLPAESPPVLTWPNYGSSAVGAVGYGLLASHGKQQPVPIASVAKVMAALAVLQKKPLQPGQQGPTLILGDQDVAFYNNYVAEEGSVVPVNYGEEISEYQALQALLLPSANNIAQSLATWAFGSEQNYLGYANAQAVKLGMKSTHFADASGFLPATTSTASDLVLLGETALKNPVLAQIVSQPQADIPVAGTVFNVNAQLGQDGINGIKTGNTEQAGGVYLVSATYAIARHQVTVITAIVGAPTLDDAMHDTLPLLASAQKGFEETTVVKAGEIVGYYNTPWQTSANVVATREFKAFGWKGAIPSPRVTMHTLQVPASRGQTVGSINLPGSAPSAITLQQSIAEPTWQWRLLHP